MPASYVVRWTPDPLGSSFKDVLHASIHMLHCLPQPPRPKLALQSLQIALHAEGSVSVTPT
jgi:hypothetical protein